MSDDKNLHDRIHGPAERRKAAEAAANPDGVVIDLAKMRPLQYAKARKEKAKLLGIPVTALDAEVKRHRPKDDDAERDFLPHWNVEAWPEEVDGDALLDELRNLFRRHAVLPEETDVAIPLWVLHTWVFDCFDITPYLAITSPTPRCGKTVLMTMLYWLCRRGKKSDSMSRAALYRSVDADKPTLILDEVNWIGGLDDERANIINGGFERNGHAETCEGEGAAIKPRLWSTFCPKAFGLIGRLTPTLMDRSIEITMRRKTPAEFVERLRRGDNAEFAAFRQKFLRWAEDNLDALKVAPEMVAPGLNDRAVDVWEPLLTVAKQAGGEWLGRALYAAKVLSASEPITDGVELLRHISAVFDGTTWPAVTTKTMIAKLCEDDEKPWATWNSGKPISAKQIGALLSPFKIGSDTVHPNETDEPKAKGYRRGRFAEAFERYLRAGAQEGGFQACKRASADETGTSDDFSIRSGTDPHVSGKCEKPANDADMHGSTEKNPLPAAAHKFSPSREASDDSFGNHNEAPVTDPEPIPIAPAGASDAARAEVEPAQNPDLTVPDFLDRRHELYEYEPKWRPGLLAGTLTDDDIAFLESGKFR
jgi:hypothetical protein